MTKSRGLLVCWVLVVLVSTSMLVGACARSTDQPLSEEPSLAPYVVTPQETVDEMLRLAEVGPDDVLYDLGSGDGRIVITAARIYGARGVGFELDPDLVRRAFDNAHNAGVSHLVDFRQQDVLTVDLSPATVVTVYLSREANLLLRPRLVAQLRPGSRVVAHEFDMGDWQPTVARRFRDDGGRTTSLYLWRIDARQP